MNKLWFVQDTHQNDRRLVGWLAGWLVGWLAGCAGKGGGVRSVERCRGGCATYSTT